MAESNIWNKTRDRDPEAGRWDNEGGRTELEREARGGFARYEDHPSGDRAGESGERGDWGRQGSWGTYANRPPFERDLWGTSVERHQEYRAPERHAGYGPTHWARPDDRIRDDVNERLTEHPYIDASEVDVQSSNGEVTINGVVEDRRSIRIIEDLAAGVSGVKDVHNLLRLRDAQQEKPAISTSDGATLA